MIAVAGYLNYAGTSFDSSMLTAGSDSVSESDDSDMTADISAEDIYAQTGEEEKTDIASLDEDYEETASADDSVGETVMASRYRRKHGSGRSESDQRADPLPQ